MWEGMAYDDLLFLCTGWPVPDVGNIYLVWRPVPQSFEVFFDLRLNKRLSKQS